MIAARVFVEFMLGLAVAKAGCLDDKDGECSSAIDSNPEELGHSLLQARRESASSGEVGTIKFQRGFHHAKAVARAKKGLDGKQPEQPATPPAVLVAPAAAECELPPAARWCEVRLQGLAPYTMAVYAGDDWVSHNICENGFWEENDMNEFGAPGSMLDIGGNIGYHTFAFSAAGWNVTTFEPMAPNLALINATMCRNPDMATRINLNSFGLGTSTQVCKMIAPEHNLGDGYTKCGDVDLKGLDAVEANQNFKEIGQFNVRRLDEALAEQKVDKVDVVKIDVEGMEAQVFAGAPNFLTQYAPRLIKSEVWGELFNSTGIDYLNMFEGSGYKIYSDTKCQTLFPDPKGALANAAIDIVMCK